MKLTDNEITNAMEDYRNSPIIVTRKGVISIGDILDLINRQKAEIERLENTIREQEDEIEYLKIAQDAIKHYAIKEFAERLKERKGEGFPFCCTVFISEIDNLVKEMVGE